MYQTRTDSVKYSVASRGEVCLICIALHTWQKGLPISNIWLANCLIEKSYWTNNCQSVSEVARCISKTRVASCTLRVASSIKSTSCTSKYELRVTIFSFKSRVEILKVRVGGNLASCLIMGTKAQFLIINNNKY